METTAPPRPRRRAAFVFAGLAGLAGCAAVADSRAQESAASRPPPDLSYVVVDGASAPEPFSDVAPNAERGSALFADPETGGCADCHAAPGVARAPSRPGPALGGVGARLSASAIRLWIANPRVLVADSAMPAYYSLDPAAAEPGSPPDAPRRAAPRLDGAAIEDLVAFLETLK